MVTIKTNIQELQSRFPAPFSTQKLVNYGEYLHNERITLRHHSINTMGEVPLSQVIGIDQLHGDISWADLLSGRGLKKLRENLERLERNPHYYLSDQEKEKLEFVKIGTCYFVKSGKHRTVIARFLEHFNQQQFLNRNPLGEVKITEYFPDYEFMALKASISKLEPYFPQYDFFLDYTDDEHQACLAIVDHTGVATISEFTRTEIPDVVERLNQSLQNSQPKMTFGRKIAKWLLFLN